MKLPFLKSTTVLAVAVMTLVLTSACEENILDAPKRPDVLEVKLNIEDGRVTYAQENNYELRFRLPPEGMSQAQYDYYSEWRVPFEVRVYNRFDEAVEGTMWIDVKLHIRPVDGSADWHRTITFADTTIQRYLTLAPGDSILVYTYDSLIWEQDDDSGRSIHHTEQFIPLVVTPRLGWNTVGGEKISWIYCDTTYLALTDTVVAFDQPVLCKAHVEMRLFKEYRTITSNEVAFNIVYFVPSRLRKKYICSEHPPP